LALEFLFALAGHGRPEASRENGHGMGNRAFSNVHGAFGDISADDQSSRI